MRRLATASLTVLALSFAAPSLRAADPPASPAAAAAAAAAAKEAAAAKFIEAEDFTAAEKALQEALELAPGRTTSQRALAYTMDRQGRTDEAIDAYRSVLEANPDDARMANNLGVALGKQGLYAEAAEVLKRAVALDPDDAQASANLKTTLKNLATLAGGQAEIDDLVSRCEANPEDADAAYALARVYANRGLTDDAMTWVAEAFKRGLRDRRVLQDDPAFASLKQDPRFVELAAAR